VTLTLFFKNLQFWTSILLLSHSISQSSASRLSVIVNTLSLNGGSGSIARGVRKFVVHGSFNSRTNVIGHLKNIDSYAVWKWKSFFSVVVHHRIGKIFLGDDIFWRFKVMSSVCVHIGNFSLSIFCLKYSFLTVEIVLI
jgi:hypothetical protein